MLWITLVMVISARAEIFEDRPSNRILYNELSITFDHCRDPQVLNAETWTCECPAPLVKKGDECVCEECLFNTNDETYVVKEKNELPEYLAGFLKDLNEEEEEQKKISESSGEIASRMLWKSKRLAKKKKQRKSLKRRKSDKLIRKYLNEIMKTMININKECEYSEYSARRSIPRVLLANNDSSFVRFLKSLRLGSKKKSEKFRIKKIDWDKSRILNLKRGKRIKPEAEGKSYSDSTIGDQTKGAIQSGEERAYGALANFYGTGSISLGVGQGSAVASAYTGEGVSVSGAESIGAKAFGMGLIGKKAFRGSSTTTLLIGEGDAIATNSQSKKSSASATAVATKKTASAGSTAFGAATAGASATPGKGSSDGSAVYGENLKVSAKVKGKSGPVAETVSVGNPEDDLSRFVENQKKSSVSKELEDTFYKKESSDFFESAANNVDDIELRCLRTIHHITPKLDQGQEKKKKKT